MSLDVRKVGVFACLLIRMLKVIRIVKYIEAYISLYTVNINRCGYVPSRVQCDSAV